MAAPAQRPSGHRRAANPARRLGPRAAATTSWSPPPPSCSSELNRILPGPANRSDREMASRNWSIGSWPPPVRSASRPDQPASSGTVLDPVAAPIEQVWQPEACRLMSRRSAAEIGKMCGAWPVKRGVGDHFAAGRSSSGPDRPDSSWPVVATPDGAGARPADVPKGRPTWSDAWLWPAPALGIDQVAARQLLGGLLAAAHADGGRTRRGHRRSPPAVRSQASAPGCWPRRPK